MKYRTTRCLTPAEAITWQGVLDGTQVGGDPFYGTPDLLHTFQARFPNGYQVDINIWNGDPTPFVEGVLFDRQGREVAPGEPDETLLGEYIWYVSGDEFELTLTVC